MDKSKKLVASKKQFTQKKNSKMKREFKEMVQQKVDENLNEDVNLVMLKKQDPGVLLAEVHYKHKDYNVYIAYRYDDIVTHMSSPKKEDQVFDLPHYLIVFTKESPTLITGELATKIIETAKNETAEEEVVRRFKTLKESVAVMGMFDGLAGLVGKEEV